jgi:hypothetical protein
MELFFLCACGGVFPGSESFGFKVWIAMRSVQSTVLLASFLAIGLGKI